MADPERRLAAKGQLVPLPDDFTVYKAGTKVPIWRLEPYQFLNTEKTAPDTVNPSLWRNARLNMYTGLFEVVKDAVYQVRGMDLSNISFLEDPTGRSKKIVVVDPLVSEECATAALKLYRDNRGEDRVITAVLFTHSHIDHYGGVLGLFEDGTVPDGVEIIAPDGFLEHAISENVYAGNPMQRRALFMYGALLERSAKGQVDAGLGKTNSTGTSGVLAPTFNVTSDIAQKGQVHRFGPVRMEFQLTPGTEAPSEMNFYLPDIDTVCMAENATPTLHNLYSLRGAQVRDAKAWSEYLRQSVEWYGDRSKVLFASHFWPRWNTKEDPDAIVSFLTSQADLYRYLHDQALRQANHGRTIIEIAEDLDSNVPLGLADRWFNRGYYGTVNHNLKAVYQRYLGWYDGNAAHLHTLPPEEAGHRYVEAIGGADKVVALARQAYENAQDATGYRWAAELLSHAVFADPNNRDARTLEADVLEQLGYQAESGPWRNFYLAAAHELRTPGNGVPPGTPSQQIITPAVLAAMPLDMLFDYVGIRLNGPDAAETVLTIGLTVTGGLATDPDQVTVQVRTGVLVYTPTAADADTADATYTITRDGLNNLAVGKTTPDELATNGELIIDTGTIEPFDTLNNLLDTFDYWFGLTLP
ncbi:MBL fold metallo-hydrolase (plasmid) [Streptomyces clavuligerus]|uniref:Beta-lactamase domain protein n=1 Tax=Streptomyces clavuligerus TaxID=1901 RepID=B5GMI9_STRCL|nr:MBL fold metallo-hydrolase [Streptomyces clavuligerus]AXU17548.1 MBL fold metallo-hydrolase [Streptomyces clavuligerus]EDY47535.1 beta-lactamase domain-containing protein [Streptomyces clavuligerus]EFG04494.1 Beta-lactamase domain protein [Streptomyces clavuligerus]MBY6307053.1 MBL fold metallo-hydrolase [Streptomyces clavuligerus]